MILYLDRASLQMRRNSDEEFPSVFPCFVKVDIDVQYIYIYIYICMYVCIIVPQMRTII